MIQFLPMLGSMFGSEFARNAIGPAMGAVGSGSLFGTRGTQSSSGSTRFDMSQLPALNQQLAQSDQASQQFMEFLRQLGGQRQAGLQADLDGQLATIQGLGNQENQDINRRYNSQQGGVGQSLANRGLYNSTVAPGMRALVERERNAALGQADARQRQYLGGVLGKRAQLLDSASDQQNQSLDGVGMSNLGLRQEIPRQMISSSQITDSNQTTKRGGIFSRLFG
jgi:hypothetical protein